MSRIDDALVELRRFINGVYQTWGAYSSNEERMKEQGQSAHRALDLLVGEITRSDAYAYRELVLLLDSKADTLSEGLRGIIIGLAQAASGYGREVGRRDAVERVDEALKIIDALYDQQAMPDDFHMPRVDDLRVWSARAKETAL